MVEIKNITKMTIGDLTVEEYTLIKEQFKKHNITDTKGQFHNIAYYTRQLVSKGKADQFEFHFVNFMLPLLADEHVGTPVNKDIPDYLAKVFRGIEASAIPTKWDSTDKYTSIIDRTWLLLQEMITTERIDYYIVCNQHDSNLIKYTIDHNSSLNAEYEDLFNIQTLTDNQIDRGTCYLVPADYNDYKKSISIPISELTDYKAGKLTELEYTINIALGMLSNDEYELLNKTVLQTPLACPKEALPYVIYHTKNFLREHPEEDFEYYFYKHLFDKASEFRDGIPSLLEDTSGSLVTLELFILGTEDFDILIDFSDIPTRKHPFWKDLAIMFDLSNALNKNKLESEYHRYSIVCHPEDVDLILDTFDVEDSKNICVANNTINISKISEQNLKKGNIYIMQSNFREGEYIKQFPLHLE